MPSRSMRTRAVILTIWSILGALALPLLRQAEVLAQTQISQKFLQAQVRYPLRKNSVEVRQQINSHLRANQPVMCRNQYVRRWAGEKCPQVRQMSNDRIDRILKRDSDGKSPQVNSNDKIPQVNSNGTRISPR